MESCLETSGDINIFKMVKFLCPKKKKTKSRTSEEVSVFCGWTALLNTWQNMRFCCFGKDRALQVIVTHCLVHRYALGCKILSSIPREILSMVVKVLYCFMIAKPWIIACARWFMKNLLLWKLLNSWKPRLSIKGFSRRFAKK